LLVQLLPFASASTYKKSFSKFATSLRSDLLQSYDKLVPPTSNRSVEYSKAGTDVGLQIRFFKAQAVNAAAGQMHLKVWVRTTWTDERLSWNSADHGNITQVHFAAHAITTLEETEIWVPDIQLYNSIQGTVLTLEPAVAVVSSDGSVYWSRPGVLSTMCKFSGLVAFPYDQLKCSMEWGGWLISGGYQGIELTGETPGYSFSKQEETAGSSYQEYSIQKIDVNTKLSFYECCPSEPWKVVKYTVTLKRASFYYVLLIITPSLLLTYLSFGVFFMSYEVGERLSFGITLVLVMEVLKTTISCFVPVCGELLWIDLFMLVCTIFCLVSLLETICVLCLSFHTAETLLPSWLVWLTSRLRCTKHTDEQCTHMEFESCASKVFREAHWQGLEDAQTTGSYSSLSGSNAVSPKAGVDTSTPRKKSSIGRSNTLPPKLSESETAKLIFFEHLFYQLDLDYLGFLTVEEVGIMLTFVRLGMSAQDSVQVLSEVHRAMDDRLSRGEFVDLCVHAFWRVPFEEIKMGADNYISAKTNRLKRLGARWLRLAKWVDQWSRFWIPLFYTTALGVLVQLDMRDRYQEPLQADATGGNAEEEMFEGLGQVSMTALGVWKTLITPAIGLFCFGAWYWMRGMSMKQKFSQSFFLRKTRNLLNRCDDSTDSQAAEMGNGPPRTLLSALPRKESSPASRNFNL